MPAPAPALRDDALALLRAWRPPTPAQALLRSTYVDHLVEHPDGLERSCHPAHLTASTLVLSPDGAWVLLTLHAKAGRWFQLGGHLEPHDRTLAEAALREAVEEGGVQPLLLGDPVHLDTHEVPFCGDRPGVRHLDVRFLAVAQRTPPRISSESTQLRWWPVSGLPSAEASLRELLDRGRQRLGTLGPRVET